MNKVVNLKEVKSLGNSNIIERLEELLAEAKSGELIDMAYVVTYTNNHTGHGWTKSNLKRNLLGELMLLQHAIATVSNDE